MTTDPTPLKDLIQGQQRHTKFIGLQAPEANKKIVFFGDQHLQPFELRPKASTMLPQTFFESLYVKAEQGTEELSIGFFDF